MAHPGSANVCRVTCLTGLVSALPGSFKWVSRIKGLFDRPSKWFQDMSEAPVRNRSVPPPLPHLLTRQVVMLSGPKPLVHGTTRELPFHERPACRHPFHRGCHIAEREIGDLPVRRLQIIGRTPGRRAFSCMMSRDAAMAQACHHGPNSATAPRLAVLSYVLVTINGYQMLAIFETASRQTGIIRS